MKYIEENSKTIHVVWYVLGLGGLRILDGDFDLIHNIYKGSKKLIL
jgi:hypothetical protein